LQFADRLYPQPDSAEAGDGQNPPPSNHDDVAAALSQEIADVKVQYAPQS
jgi:hypothetical protein